MISLWKLIELAQKWRRVAGLRRKRISFMKANRGREHLGNSQAPRMAEKRHFTVYTADQKRFEFPIKYLNNCIIRELLMLSEEEFGLPKDGPIMLPCDSHSMEHVISLIRENKGKDLQKNGLTISVPTGGCSASSTHQRHFGSQLQACP